MKDLSSAERAAEARGLDDKRAALAGQKTRQQAVRARTMDPPGTGPSEQIARPPQPVEAEESSLLQLLHSAHATTNRRSAQQQVHLEHRGGGFVACIGSTDELQSAWEGGDVLRRIYIAQHDEDVFKRADGSWRERTFKVRWLLNADEDDASAYSFEFDSAGEVMAPRVVECNSILCAVELEKIDESEQPSWRLPDEMLVRLRGLGQEAVEENVEQRLARDAEQLIDFEEERDATRGAEATNVADTSTSRAGRPRSVSSFQLDQRDRTARSASASGGKRKAHS